MTQEEKVTARLKKVYAQAQRELKKKLQAFTKQFQAQDREKQAQLAAGLITQAEYDSWKQGKVFAGEQWQKQLKDATDTLADANAQALKIINGEKMDAFAESANKQAYKITKDAGANLSFAIYDKDAVGRLVEEQPELLPRKVLNGKKDRAWNKSKIINAITQSIIQGESLEDTAERIAKETASQDMAAMVRYARTAMTGAQNAGRVDTMKRAEQMGIKVKKLWIATLDNRTRDAHAGLDGQTALPDQPFHSDLGPIMYPGDPNAKPANVYNCRCTLGYDYEDFPSDPEKDVRRDNESGQVLQNMQYNEWKAAKEGGKLNELNVAKTLLAAAQKLVMDIDEGEVFHNIWKDDVTYADYEQKKGSISAKRQYYNDEIAKIKAAQAAGESWATDAKLKEKQGQLAQLDRFEKNGKLVAQRDKAAQDVKDVLAQVGGPAQSKKAAALNGPFTPDAYTDERKKKALKASTPQEADQAMRARTGEVWRGATDAEKDAAYEYTQSYHKFNEPLRGIEYGTSRYIGVGKTDLDAGYAQNGRRLDALTDILGKCTYDQDVWLRRGVGYDGVDKFLQCTQGLLRSGTQAQLEKELLGRTVTEYGFMSCGSTTAAGFHKDIDLRIYAPRGTQMMYVEPFSAFGGGMVGKSWDGISGQSAYRSEVETLLQQNTQLRVTKVTRSGKTGKITIELEVIGQDKPQRWKK